MEVAAHRESLDVLRGILALVVCIAHAWYIFLFPSGGKAALPIFDLAARVSVLCFFCLSGYVIAMSIEKNIARHGSFEVFDFARARVYRIVPPLLTAMVVVKMLDVALHAVNADRLPDGMETARRAFGSRLLDQLISLGTLCSRGDLTGGVNGPLWSLAYEVNLYVIAGLTAFVAFARSRVISRILGMALLGWYLVLAVPFGWTIQIVSIIVFLAGSAAYAGRNQIGAGATWAAGSASVAAAILILARGGNYDTSGLLLAAQATLGIGGSVLVARIAQSNNFRASPLLNLGGFAYTLYVLHFPTLLAAYFLLARLMPGNVGRWPVAILVTAGTILVTRILSVVEQARPRQRRRGRALSTHPEEAC